MQADTCHSITHDQSYCNLRRTTALQNHYTTVATSLEVPSCGDGRRRGDLIGGTQFKMADGSKEADVLLHVGLFPCGQHGELFFGHAECLLKRETLQVKGCVPI